jgi:hypothetical protein
MARTKLGARKSGEKRPRAPAATKPRAPKLTRAAEASEAKRLRTSAEHSRYADVSLPGLLAIEEVRHAVLLSADVRGPSMAVQAKAAKRAVLRLACANYTLYRAVAADLLGARHRSSHGPYRVTHTLRCRFVCFISDSFYKVYDAASE